MNLQRTPSGEEILRHKLAMCSLNNTLAPISRLPNELLASIFVRLARDDFLTHTFPIPKAPGCVNVSHVSTHWRNVALNCATLWSYIFTTSRRWIEASFERSEETPLRLYLEIKEDGCDLWLSTLFKLLNNTGRIEELHFFTRWWDTEVHQIFTTLCSSAPHLRILELALESRYPAFDANAPVIWRFSNLCTLTTLNLFLVPLSHRLDIQDLRAALACMPDLKQLYLDEALVSTHNFMEFNAFPKIHMPRLARLLVVAPVSTVIAFLSSVDIPAHTETKLECKLEENATSDIYDQLCHVLARTYTTLSTIRSVVMLHSYHRIAVAFSASLECDYLPPSSYSLIGALWDDKIRLEILLNLPASPPWNVFGGNIIATIPAINVQTLYIVDPPSCQAFWRQTLEHVPGLRHMKLSAGFITHGLVTLLRPRTEGTMVPELDWLELVDIQFSTDPGTGLATHSETDGESYRHCLTTDAQSLYAALASRQGRGRLSITTRDAGDKYDMVGEWGSGHFRIISERCHEKAEEGAEEGTLVGRTRLHWARLFGGFLF